MKRVQRGERITVTDRGEPVAVIGPAVVSPRTERFEAMLRVRGSALDGRQTPGVREAGPAHPWPIGRGGDHQGSPVILYLGASALVKLYVDEEGVGQVRKGVQDAEIIATCEIAYIEVRAALARRHREGALKPADYRRALRNLRADWPRFFLITVSSQLVWRAISPHNTTFAPTMPSIWRRASRSSPRRGNP